MSRILVYRSGALGDTILLGPFLGALRSARPGARITLACNMSYGLVLRDAGLCDDLLSVDAALWAAFFSSSQGALPGEFHEAFLFTAGGTSDFTKNLGERIPVLHCLDTNPVPNEHISRSLSKGLSLNQEHFLSGNFRLSFPDAAARRERWVRVPMSRLLIMHPGAGSPSKRWAAENFEAIMHRWCSTPKNVCAIIRGPAEKEESEHLETPAFTPSAKRADQVIMFDNIPLTDLACIFAGAPLFLGNDSGITHLAALSGARGAALFGATDPVVWRPLSLDCHVLQRFTSRDSRPDMDVETVWTLLAGLQGRQ